MLVKEILCFGDSNTYGVNPANQERFCWNIRWTGRLQGMLGENYNVVEEGLGGRNTVWDDPLAIGRNGYQALPMILESHKPIDLVVLGLGTNDCRSYLNASPEVIGFGALQLIELIRRFDYGTGCIPQILLLGPIDIGTRLECIPVPLFDQSACNKIREVRKIYAQIAEDNHCLFFDASTVARPGCDQIHMDEESHKNLAQALYDLIQNYYEGSSLI